MDEQPKEPTIDELRARLEDMSKALESYQFLSDQLKFNATMYNGLRLTLEKLDKALKLLEKDEKPKTST